MDNLKQLTIATRKSPLALCQANYIKQQLLTAYPHLNIEFLELTTQGDIHLATPLAEVGGKGLFVKELEQALLDGRADIAVHSMKDVPNELPAGLTIEIICKREEANDAFISNKYHALNELPLGSRIGTSSLRRHCLLKINRPDLEVISLRGNVDTRLRKLDNNDFDAIILAAAGLIRLNIADRIRELLPIESFLPAVGQGALGIECRQDDTHILNGLQILNDPHTAHCITAERAFNKQLNGGCQTPIAGYAFMLNSIITLRGFVGRPDGKTFLQGSVSGTVNEAEIIGTQLAHDLLRNGADKILQEVKHYG